MVSKKNCFDFKITRELLNTMNANIYEKKKKDDDNDSDGDNDDDGDEL